MARIRSVHPGFFTDEDYVRASAYARLLFIGLGVMADDKGIFEWKPITLKMKIFPADNINIDDLLSELMGVNAVKKYEINGRYYGAIRKFTKYQRPKTPNNIHPISEEIRNYITSNEHTSESFPQNVEIPPQREEGGDNVEEINGIGIDSGAAQTPLPPTTTKQEIYFGEKNQNLIPDRQVVPISAEFDPDDEWGKYAEKMGFVNGIGLRELEKFIAYWTAGKGSGARKTKRGWRQAWSNWLEIAAKRM
jgi:hypothetical protein